MLVLDLRQHDQQWVRERLGDRWLGFEDAELARLMKGSALTDVEVRTGARLTGDPFTVLIACGTRAPGAAVRARGSRVRGASDRVASQGQA